MLPRDHDLRNLALYSPRIAWAMMVGVPRVPFVGDMTIEFDSATVGAPPIVQSLQNNLTQDTLIERVSFSCYQQNSSSGSPFQSLYFAMLKQATGVGVNLQVYGGPKYNVNDTFTPLENLADVLAITWPNGWPLDKQSNVKASAVLLQTPQSTPYDIYLTLLGWQWLDKCMDDMTDAEARAKLAAVGITVPNLAAVGGA
jgi:hypothetical protein